MRLCNVWNGFVCNDLKFEQRYVLGWDRDNVTWSHSSVVIGWDTDDVIFKSLMSEKGFASWRQPTKEWQSLSTVYIFSRSDAIWTHWYRKGVPWCVAKNEQHLWNLVMNLGVGFGHQSGICKQWLTRAVPQRRGHPAWNGNVFYLFQITHNMFRFLRQGMQYNDINTTHSS